ncbi:MAG: hypothetical protein AB1894_27815 [Chloroflexota bacterium]
MRMKPETTRFNLTLPTKVVGELENIAEEYEVSVTDVMRAFLRIGLMVAKTQKDQNKAILVREGEREAEIIFTPLW